MAKDMANENPFDLIQRKFEGLENSITEIRKLFLENNAPAEKDVGGMPIAVEETGLSTHSIYRLVHERKIPHSKRGGRLYFSRKVLRAWIAQGDRKTNQIKPSE